MDFNNLEDYVRNAESNRNSAVLNSLLESEPGMKELPDTTNAKEGDVLVLDSQKKPTWGSGGGSGGGVLVVNGTMDVLEGTVTLDKTYGEIESALEECPFAVAVINTPTRKTIGTLSVWSPHTADNYYYAFNNMGSLLEFSGENGTDYPVTQLSNNGGGGGDVTPA